MNSMLVALNDSASSRAVIEFLPRLSLCPDEVHITLMHLLRKPSAGSELMGHRFMEEQPKRLMEVLNQARADLAEKGFKRENIEIDLVTEPYATVTEGIIDQCKKKEYSMVVIGRKRMSKAEEFVLGDISVKLVRSLEGRAILVIKAP
jgi:nucleotide-binding universal stress UspA family protein